MENDTKFAVLEEQLKNLQKDYDSLKQEQSICTKNDIELQVKSEQLEKRLIQHSARHESYYKELRLDFKSFKEDFETFKTNNSDELSNILGKLEEMKGRDSVLKFLFGTIFGGVSIALIIELIKGITQ